MIPTLGRIVLYTVPTWQVPEINARRQDARDRAAWHMALRSGAQVHAGNGVKEGDVFPAMIVAVWGKDATSAVNLKVFLDGTDVYWATSVSVGEGPGKFAWPALPVPDAPSS